MISSPLSSLLRVAELGSVSRAALALHLTQPAVTKQLRALERELGTALVERVGRGIELTAAGQVLCEYGRRGSALFDECRGLLTEMERGTAGKLALGAGVTTSIFQLPRWLKELQREQPGIDVSVRTGSSRVIEGLVLDCKVELGLVTSAVERHELVATELYSEQIVLVGAADYRRARGSGRLELAELPLILFPADTGFRAYLDARLAARGLVAKVKMESDSVEAIKSFVSIGLGASFLPIAAVEAELRSRKLKRLHVAGLPSLRRRTACIRRHDRRPSAAVRLFIDIVRGRA